MGQELFIPAFKGLIPVLDRKKVKDYHVVDGKNFILDADGPYSGLGRSLIAYKAITNPTNVQSFKIAETLESFIATNEGIFRLDTETEKLVPVYDFPSDITTVFPWSMAAVGNKYYFARPNSNLIEYDIVSNVWTELTGGSIPSDIYACCESEGRLCLLTDTLVSWSAIGDGSDHTPSTVTGAGQQALTKLGTANTSPLGIRKVPDGFLTFTTSGIMKSQAINSQNPFRHTVLSSKHIPINPYCIADIDDDTTVFLARAGLFSTNGSRTSGQTAIITEWQPAMSEHMRNNIIPQIDIENNQNNIQLVSDFDRSWFVISIAQSQQNYIYNLGYILYRPVGEWGAINDPYVTILDVKIQPLSIEGYTLSVVDLEGSILRFDSSTGVETIPLLQSGYYYHSFYEEIPARKVDDTIVFVSDFVWRTVNTSEMDATGLYDRYYQAKEYLSPVSRIITEKPATTSEIIISTDYGLITDSVGTSIDLGAIVDSVISSFDYDLISNAVDSYTLYEFKENTIVLCGLLDIIVAALPKIFSSLDSYIEVGTIRMSKETDNDRYSYLTNLSVGMDEEATSSEDDDWLDPILYPSDYLEDWLTLSDQSEDWGDDATLVVNYDVELKPSLDGYKVLTDYTPLLELVKSDGKMRFYSCESMGIYHTIKFSAMDVGGNYHLKTLDLTLNLGGRL